MYVINKGVGARPVRTIDNNHNHYRTITRCRLQKPLSAQQSMLCQEMMRRQGTVLCERTMLHSKKRLQKPVKTFCMLLTHKPRAPRAFRAEHEQSLELLEPSRAKNSLLVRARAGGSARGFEPSIRPRARAVTRAAHAWLGSLPSLTATTANSVIGMASLRKKTMCLNLFRLLSHINLRLVN